MSKHLILSTFAFCLVLVSACSREYTAKQAKAVQIPTTPQPLVVPESEPSQPEILPSFPPLQLEEEGVLDVRVTPDRRLIPKDHTKKEIIALSILNNVAILFQFVPQEDGELAVRFFRNPIALYLPSCDLANKTCPETGQWIAEHQKLYVERLSEPMTPEGIQPMESDASFTIFYEPRNPREQQLLFCGQRQQSGVFGRLEDAYVKLYSAKVEGPSKVRICRFIPWREETHSFAADLWEGWRLRKAIIAYF